MSYRASGLRAWIWQRVSAVILAVFIVLILGNWLRGGPTDYHDWNNTIAQTPITLIIGLSFGALLAHAWVGVRDIFIDYISHSGLRHTLLSLLALWLLTLGLWVFLILARVFVISVGMVT